MNVVEGRMEGRGLKIGLVVSRFNEMVTEGLLKGATDILRRSGVAEKDMTVVRVPGSFEIPLAAQLLAAQGEVDAVVCLGALIQGETDHYGYLASAVTSGIAQVSLKHEIPVTFGVLTTRDVEQAVNRAGLKHGNKGMEAALTAIEMVNLKKALSKD